MNTKEYRDCVRQSLFHSELAGQWFERVANIRRDEIWPEPWRSEAVADYEKDIAQSRGLALGFAFRAAEILYDWTNL